MSTLDSTSNFCIRPGDVTFQDRQAPNSMVNLGANRNPPLEAILYAKRWLSVPSEICFYRRPTREAALARGQLAENSEIRRIEP